jgi:hypothetical protein
LFVFVVLVMGVMLDRWDAGRKYQGVSGWFAWSLLG